jgi:16S rRNA processing protein RimM
MSIAVASSMQVVIGRIGRAHGIRGELNVDIRTDEPERRFAPGSSVVCGNCTLTVKTARHHGGRLVVAFEEIADRTAAEKIHGTILEAVIDPDELPDDPDEFYDHQLVGLQVRVDDVAVGTVTGLVHLPHQDTLTVDIDGREVFIPFVTELVPVVDVAGGFVTVRDVEGLLDPTKAENAAADLVDG